MKPELKAIDALQRANSESLAFYPLAALEEDLERGRLVACEENGELAGYLWHGPVRPGRDITIYQACVDYQARRRTLGLGMVEELEQLAELAGATGIRLTCGAELEANAFWSAAGFYCTAVDQGGRRRARDLNRYRIDLQPTLELATAVEPSTKPTDYAGFNADRRAKLAQASRFSRTHYARGGHQ